jgi:ABC-type branched-subunit amino acid transport system ATPase component/predicted MFS family arabinose efflux permease
MNDDSREQRIEERDLQIASPEAEQQEPTFIQRGAESFKTLLREASNYKMLKRTPYGLRPVIIFTIIGVVSSFDSGIFAQATPEILQELGAGAAEIFRILSILAIFLTFAHLGLGYLSDRVRRIPILGLGVIVNGLFSIFTTRANSEWSLGMYRAGDNLGGLAMEVPVSSLQADYYPPEHRGKAFALQGVSARAALLAVPLGIAFLVTQYGWRSPFVASGTVMVLLGILTFVGLKEPIRGYMERKALGVSDEVARVAEERPSFGEAWRTIWSIRTLRRLFLADIPSGVANRTFSFFFTILLFEHYGLNITQRAVIGTVLGLMTLPFGFMAGGLIDVLMRRRPQRVLIFSGLLSLAVALTLIVVAALPPLWFLIVVSVIFGAVSSLLGPARNVLYVQILPAHVRTLGLSVRILATIPAQLIQGSLIGLFVTRWGNQGGLIMTVPFAILGALMDLSAAGFFDRDMRSAIASQLASEEYRRAKKAGRGKLLVCRDVDVEYDGVQVLFGVDFDVEEGDIIALLGTNGAGKSTLLKAISGTQEASSGAIVIDGRDTTHMPPPEVAARGVTHMPGGRGIFPELSVRENLMLGTWMIDQKEAGLRIDEVYQIFPVLKERAGTKAGQLSGGEQQMLSLAQAFLTKPRLLMIDELSLGLSPAVVAQLIEIVKRIHAAGTTIILVEQSVNVALTIAERAIFMEKGEVRFVGKTADLLSRPDILRAVYVKGTSQALVEPTSSSTFQTESERRAFRLESARTILDVKEISKTFGGVVALESVSLGLREGEILGLIGPNGAGKTTLFDVISGYIPPDSGHVIFEGVDITNLPVEQRAATGLIRRFQDARLVPSLTVYENLLLALDQKLDAKNSVLIALQLPQVRQAERRVRIRAERLIELLRLEAYRDKFVKELSTGLKRMVDLACVLASEPKVLLLDEPSTGIAQAEAEGLTPLLRRVRFETGCSMLVIEHDMNLISSVSDELFAMDQGRFVMRGTAEEVLNDDRVIQSYLGTSEEVIQRSGLKK